MKEFKTKKIPFLSKAYMKKGLSHKKPTRVDKQKLVQRYLF